MLIDAMDRAFDRCEETLNRTSGSILCWLHTYHGTRFYPKPFKRLFREASRQKYRRLWKKFIVFIFRAYRMARRLRRAVLGMRFTKEQLKQLKIVWTDPSLGAEACCCPERRSGHDVGWRNPTGPSLTLTPCTSDTPIGEHLSSFGVIGFQSTVNFLISKANNRGPPTRAPT